VRSIYLAKAALFPRDPHNNRLPLAFASLRKPRPQALGKSLRRQAKTGFDNAIRNWQSIVKIRGIREVPHAELIQPFEWAGAALPANHDIDFEFLCVHSTIITSR